MIEKDDMFTLPDSEGSIYGDRKLQGKGAFPLEIVERERERVEKSFTIPYHTTIKLFTTTTVTVLINLKGYYHGITLRFTVVIHGSDW